MIIDGDMEGLPAGVLRTSATASIATNGNPLIAGHSLDVEMQQISRKGMFIAHHGWSGMQIAPAIEMSPPQDTADGGWTESGALGDLIARAMLAAVPSQAPRDYLPAEPSAHDSLGDLIRKQSEQSSQTSTQTAAKKGEKTYGESDRQALDKLFQTSGGGK